LHKNCINLILNVEIGALMPFVPLHLRGIFYLMILEKATFI